MTKTTSADWNPEQDLAVLLDALTEELLAVSGRDIAAWLGETGNRPEAMAQDMRRLVAAAEADLIVPPLSGFFSQGLRFYVDRNQ